ncbi:AhpC/TSA family protein [Paenibacillus lycopersici]|uniref:thioredoxin-dependent peroxiredoxin n=1 Tax=Paenibacillus lycopersici TaxID=2704462 RepID=A0A6C0G1L6_9BACL|nr:peroxiredoxin-like family protein [Paenibacillus lycopersici]QHT61244.1 AhpC/TSA family protein [Paenibacillus lycopersici]
MQVNRQLEQAKAAFMAKVPAEAQEVIFRHIREQQQIGHSFGLKEGDKAPDFKLNGHLGEEIALCEELARGPVILVFYRGDWCPFCNIQLRAFQRCLPRIRELNGRLIAISPQSQDHSLSQKEKEQLEYTVLSDPDGQAGAGYKLLFELPDYLQHALSTRLKLDLADYNRTYRWILPVPATYVIGQNGIIRHAHVDPDFMERAEPEVIIDQLRNLAGQS